MTFLFHLMQFLAYLPLKIIYPTRVIGRKNMPKDRAVICANHTSNQDAVLLAGNTFERKYYLAKIELFKKKFNAGFLKIIGGVPIDRNNPSLGQIKDVLGKLKKGKKLVVFPEGTRIEDMVEKGEMGEIKNGAVMFALKTKSPIVPVWFSRRPKVFRLTKIEIGKPISLEEFYDKKLDEQTLEQASKLVSEKLLEMGKKYANGKI